MNKKQLAKLLIKHPEIKALYESQAFDASTVSKVIAEEILKEESDERTLDRVSITVDNAIRDIEEGRHQLSEGESISDYVLKKIQPDWDGGLFSDIRKFYTISILDRLKKAGTDTEASRTILEDFEDNPPDMPSGWKPPEANAKNQSESESSQADSSSVEIVNVNDLSRDEKQSHSAVWLDIEDWLKKIRAGEVELKDGQTVTDPIREEYDLDWKKIKTDERLKFENFYIIYYLNKLDKEAGTDAKKAYDMLAEFHERAPKFVEGWQAPESILRSNSGETQSEPTSQEPQNQQSDDKFIQTFGVALSDMSDEQKEDELFKLNIALEKIREERDSTNDELQDDPDNVELKQKLQDTIKQLQDGKKFQKEIQASMQSDTNAAPATSSTTSPEQLPDTPSGDEPEEVENGEASMTPEQERIMVDFKNFKQRIEQATDSSELDGVSREVEDYEIPTHSDKSIKKTLRKLKNGANKSINTKKESLESSTTDQTSEPEETEQPQERQTVTLKSNASKLEQLANAFIGLSNDQYDELRQVVNNELKKAKDEQNPWKELPQGLQEFGNNTALFMFDKDSDVFKLDPKVTDIVPIEDENGKPVTFEISQEDFKEQYEENKEKMEEIGEKLEQPTDNYGNEIYRKLDNIELEVGKVETKEDLEKLKSELTNLYSDDLKFAAKTQINQIQSAIDKKLEQLPNTPSGDEPEEVENGEASMTQKQEKKIEDGLKVIFPPLGSKGLWPSKEWISKFMEEVFETKNDHLTGLVEPRIKNSVLNAFHLASKTIGIENIEYADVIPYLLDGDLSPKMLQAANSLGEKGKHLRKVNKRNVSAQIRDAIIKNGKGEAVTRLMKEVIAMSKQKAQELGIAGPPSAQQGEEETTDAPATSEDTPADAAGSDELPNDGESADQSTEQDASENQLTDEVRSLLDSKTLQDFAGRYAKAARSVEKIPMTRGALVNLAKKLKGKTRGEMNQLMRDMSNLNTEKSAVRRLFLALLKNEREDYFTNYDPSEPSDASKPSEEGDSQASSSEPLSNEELFNSIEPALEKRFPKLYAIPEFVDNLKNAIAKAMGEESLSTQSNAEESDKQPEQFPISNPDGEQVAGELWESLSGIYLSEEDEGETASPKPEGNGALSVEEVAELRKELIGLQRVLNDEGKGGVKEINVFDLLPDNLKYLKDSEDEIMPQSDADSEVETGDEEVPSETPDETEEIEEEIPTDEEAVQEGQEAAEQDENLEDSTLQQEYAEYIKQIDTFFSAPNAQGLGFMEQYLLKRQSELIWNLIGTLGKITHKGEKKAFGRAPEVDRATLQEAEGSDVSLTPDDQVSIKTDLTSLLKALKATRKMINEYESKMTRVSVDPSLDGSSLKTTLDRYLPRLQRDIAKVIERCHEAWFNATKIKDQYTSDDDKGEDNEDDLMGDISPEEYRELNEILSEITLQEDSEADIQMVNRIYDQMRLIYLPEEDSNLSEGLQGLLADGDEKRAIPEAEKMYELATKEEFISLFPTGMLGKDGIPVTVKEASDSLGKLIKGLVDTMKDVIMLAKGETIPASQLSLMVSKLFLISQAIQDFFGAKMQISEDLLKRIEETLSKQPEEKALTDKEPSEPEEKSSGIWDKMKKMFGSMTDWMKNQGWDNLLAWLNKVGFLDLFRRSKNVSIEPKNIQKYVKDMDEEEALVALKKLHEISIWLEDENKVNPRQIPSLIKFSENLKKQTLQEFVNLDIIADKASKFGANVTEKQISSALNDLEEKDQNLLKDLFSEYPDEIASYIYYEMKGLLTLKTDDKIYTATPEIPDDEVGPSNSGDELEGTEDVEGETDFKPTEEPEENETPEEEYERESTNSTFKTLRPIVDKFFAKDPEQKLHAFKVGRAFVKAYLEAKSEDDRELNGYVGKLRNIQKFNESAGEFNLDTLEADLLRELEPSEVEGEDKYHRKAIEALHYTGDDVPKDSVKFLADNQKFYSALVNYSTRFSDSFKNRMKKRKNKKDSLEESLKPIIQKMLKEHYNY